MNERSSRSHTIFRLTLKSTENNLENASMQISHLYLVDLAGSERIAHTNAQGVRLKEGVNINKSLLALGNVIRQLSEGEGYINYRDSNLTRLLQQALGGNAKSLIIATITIAAGEETRSTLEFAQRAKVVKNKPIINKLLSEQDKLKQYELATEAYKVRLKKEAQRIREMEKEKEEREQEMLKLKQQVKLIDLFTNGPDQKNIESRIPRRHTMGHYASRIPLQTIPESRMLPSNIMPEKSFGNGTKSDLDDEQLFLKRASQVSDYECMKMSIEETLDDVMLPVTPEPSEELTVQEPTTPASHLRERLRYLEESYTSLKEFTKLEAQCREDKDVLQDLVKEKENLLKDLIDMNVIIRDTRQEKEQIKMKFEDEIATLKKDLQCVTQKCDRFSFALEQAEAEKDALRLAKEQLLNDNEVILDQQKLKYENKLEYFMKEIEKLKEHGTENHKEEIQRLRKENEDFKSNIVKITIYEEKIEELEEKLQKFERKEEEDIDILSKLYFLQDILLDDNVDIQGVSTQTEELTLEVNEAEKTVIKDVTNETITQKVYEELKEKIEILNGKLKDMQTLNLALGNEIDAQKEQIHSKDVKIEELTNNLKKINFGNKEEIQYREQNILKLNEKVKNLEEIQEKDNEILQLRNQLKFFETSNCDNKKYIQARDDKILELTDKINDLEKCNNDNNEEIHLRDNHILELKNKITDLEKCSQVNKDLIQIRDNKILELTNRINDLEKCNDDNNEVKDNHILELKNKITDLEKCSQVNKDLIQIRDNKILELTNRIVDLEKCNDDNNEIKDNHILELKNKITDLEKCSQVNKDLIQIRDNKILELTNRINDLEKCNDDNKEKIHVRDNHILELRNKLTDLEKCNQVNKDLIRIRDNKILELNNRINDLEKCNDDNKEKIQVKDNRMLELRNKLTDLEKCNQDNKDLIQIRDNKILELTNRINGLEKCNDGNKEKILVRDNHILELRNKLTDLEKCNPVNKNLIQIRDNKILELTNRIDDLEKCNDDNKEKIQVRDNRILELRNKLTDLEKCNRDNKDLIQIRDNKILELINRINDLEKCNDDNKEKIQVRDNRILELRNKIICLEKCNKEDISRYKDHIKSRDDTIMELNNKITKLNEACRNYEDDVSQCKKGIFHQERRIKELTTGKIDSNTCRSSVSPSSHDPSPKELRKMKRQSIHDQRRGIDLAAAAAIVSDEEPTIKTLKEKIEYLTNENKFLEFEVQGFIRELDDCKLYNRERDKEIDVLQEQIKKMKNVKVQEKCTECQQKRHYIKQLEDLQKINKFKIVDLQTKIYDLENVLKTEKANMEEKERCMRYDITELERRLSDGPPPKLEDAEIQCELVNIEQLLEKYSVVKKLARMRRNEANILRARLGIDPDEPVT
ncbi:centromere-associated protein E-like isoform X2 [Anoplophora glabripennis]|uniref:centromere-associated protein E-like isoform X2 n=1 Tax=Anoplophora glabripennis TaxID=217634 RepID=UPI000C77BDF8|nr:centromere-associated protein E-like isoform X2 [Anoplophora glabripennis]